MADTIFNTEVIDVADPKVRAIALRVAREAELAVERVAAHHAHPKKFRLPAGGSLENVLAARFDSLPEVTKKNAGNSATARLQAAPSIRQRRFKDLAKVDLTSDKSVEQQVDKLPFPQELKLPKDHLTRVGNQPRQLIVGVPSQLASPEAAKGLQPQATTDNLELRIHKVRCVDETNGFLGSEAGDDEIDLGGTTVDESGDTKKVSPFRVRSDFDDGEEQVYSPPRRFTSFNLTEGTAFPKSYFATLVLAEVDMGGLPDFLNKLLEWVKARVVAALAAAIGGAIGASGGPIGAIIGAAVGYVVGLVFEFFKSVWNDDIFPPKTVSVAIPSLTARWPGGRTDSPEGVATFSGHGGTYQVTYDWRLFA